jgi:hypothetical protein
MMVEELTDKTIAGFVFGHSRSVILLSYNSCCAQSKFLAELMMQCSMDNPDFLFGQIDAFNNHRTQDILGITLIPTVLLLRHGEVRAKKIVGPCHREVIDSVVEKAKSSYQENCDDIGSQ